MTDRPESDRARPRSARTVASWFCRLAVLVLAVLALYTAAYGAARWRKYIVMSAYNDKEQGVTVRHPQPGFDLRRGWRGQARNDALFAVFQPLCALEDWARGGETPYR